MIEIYVVAHPPGDVVVSARGVAAHAESADETVFVIKRETTAEDDDAARALADEGILVAAVTPSVSCAVGSRRLWIAERQAEQKAVGLRARIKVGRRDRFEVEAELERRVGLGHCDVAATEPLILPFGAAEGHSADRALAIDDHRPHSLLSKPPFDGPPLGATL